MDADNIFNAYVLSRAAAQYDIMSSCMEDVQKSTLLLKLHKVCTDALLLISPDSACQSREEARYLEGVAKVAKTLLESSGSCLWFWQNGRHLDGDQRLYSDFAHVWEMTTECVAYIVNQVLGERNMAADDDAKPELL